MMVVEVVVLYLTQNLTIHVTTDLRCVVQLLH